MKTILSIPYIILLFIALLCNSCKKYPQDKHYSLRTAKNRLAGTYILEKYIVNGIDSTCLIPKCVAIENLKYGVADGNYYYQFNNNHTILGMDGSGLYELRNNNNDFEVGYNIGSNLMQQTPRGVDCIRKILRLNGKEFWIKQTIDNLIIEIHLKKIHKYED